MQNLQSAVQQVSIPAPAQEKTQAPATALNVGIIGNGNSARALAAYLSSLGHRVNLVARSPEKIEFLGKDKLIKAEGKLEGTYTVAGVGTCIREFAEKSEYIFIATITSAYAEIAGRLAHVLKDHHKIILFSGKLGGTLVFEQALKQSGCAVPARVLETDALFACRVKEEENSIWIRGFKNWTLFSSAQASKTQDDAFVLQQFFPNLSPAKNIIQRGLTDFGAVAHAAIALANMNLISRKTPFRFYYDGMTEETIRLLEEVENEFRLIAQAYASDLIPMKELLNRYYGCDTTSLYSAMTSVPNYRYSLGPDSLQHRFLYEDICSTLVPASALAKLAGFESPVIDGIISIVSAVTGKNLKAEGRSLIDLGFAGTSYEQVLEYVNS